MKTTFIITSAIYTGAGIFPPDIRVMQTLSTIDSIRRFFPDAITIVVEGGTHVDDAPGFKAIQERTNVFIDMTQDEQIKYLHEIIQGNPNTTEMGGTNGVVKTIAELTLTQSVLNGMLTRPEMENARNVDRIFKISGRYQLSPLFNPAEHYHHDHWVFRKKDPTWNPSGGIPYFYSSRLFSFCPTLLEATRDKYNAMIEDAHAIADEGKYIDLEHLLYKHIGPDRTVELKNTHLYGAIGPNSLMIYD